MKHIDVEKLKAFVQKGYDSAKECEEYDDDMYETGRADAYEDIMHIIDSLQQEMWKPREEQITAVEAAYSVLNSHDTWGEDEHLPTLMSLINDLQKLL